MLCINGMGVCVAGDARRCFQAAPVKSHARCMNKSESKRDYLNKPEPRAAYVSPIVSRWPAILYRSDVLPLAFCL